MSENTRSLEDHCGEVQFAPNADNAWIGSFASSVNSFPVIGGLVSSLIGPSVSAHQLKCIPGRKFDVRTGWEKEKLALTIAAVMVVAFVGLKYLKK